MSPDRTMPLSTYLSEFEKLKDEQIQRIGYRDNILYVTLAAVGTVTAFAISSPQHHYALLVAPIICVVLGWTYVDNDAKVSCIGEYLSSVLAKRLTLLMEDEAGKHGSYLGWENWYKTGDPGRTLRKWLQLIIDLLAFCGTGSGTIALFFLLAEDPPKLLVAVAVTEVLLVGVILYVLLGYSDTVVGRKLRSVWPIAPRHASV